MEKWIDYAFDDCDCRTKPDFSRFSHDLKTEIERQLNGSGYKIEGYTKGYFYVSGFVSNNKNGRYAYFNVGDVRATSTWSRNILVREARKVKDYTGGINHIVSLDNIGAEIRKIMERPRSEF